MKPGKVARLPSAFRIEDDPIYRPHLDRLADLTEQANGLRKRIADLDTTPQTDELLKQAHAVLAGGDVTDIEFKADSRPQMEAARAYLAIVERAIILATQIEAAERRKAITRYFDSLQPEYLAIAKQTADALVALGQAQIAAVSLQNKIHASRAGDWPAGVRGPLGVGRVGHPLEELSLIGEWLIAALRHGAVQPSDIPAEWRSEWGVLRDLERHATGSFEGSQVRSKIARMANNASIPNARRRAADRAARRGGSRNW